MKNQLTILLLFLFLGNINANNCKSDSFPPKLLEECDACGCSANGGSMGFNSVLSKKFIGLRYIHQNYQSRDGVFNDSPWIEENFTTIQLWGRFPVSKKIEAMALVPYHRNNRQKVSENQQYNGLGDITLMGFYTLFQTENQQSKILQKAQIGAGLKLPTGVYDVTNNGSVNPSFQLGTGSWDYSLFTEYSIQYQKYGLNATLNYIFKGENNKKYRFGNQFNYSAMLFYTSNVKKMTISPQIGVAGEVYATNQDHNEPISLTKGSIMFGKIGLETNYENVVLGVNAMLPTHQNLTGGRVKANFRWAISLNYNF